MTARTLPGCMCEERRLEFSVECHLCQPWMTGAVSDWRTGAVTQRGVAVAAVPSSVPGGAHISTYIIWSALGLGFVVSNLRP